MIGLDIAECQRQSSLTRAHTAAQQGVYRDRSADFVAMGQCHDQHMGPGLATVEAVDVVDPAVTGFPGFDIGKFDINGVGCERCANLFKGLHLCLRQISFCVCHTGFRARQARWVCCCLTGCRADAAHASSQADDCHYADQNGRHHIKAGGQFVAGSIDHPGHDQRGEPAKQGD